MTRYAPLDWYDTPRYYDIIYDQDTAREARFLSAVHRRYVKSRGSAVLEPACGSGRLIAALARRGFDVHGFDANRAMIEFARKRLDDKNIDAALKQARLEKFTYRQRFDMAHCLVSTFKYIQTEPEARSHLQCVADVLRPGGVYVLGLHLTDYNDRHRTRERWTGQRGSTHVTCNVQGWPADARKRRERVRSRLIVQENGEVRRQETYWYFRTYSRRQLEKLLASVPAFTHLATYDFWHDPNDPVSMHDAAADKVSILQRKREV